MEKGKGLARRWAVEFVDTMGSSSSLSSTSGISDPLGFSRSSQDQVFFLCKFWSFFLGFQRHFILKCSMIMYFLQDDANGGRQKKDAEVAWKAQVFFLLRVF